MNYSIYHGGHEFQFTFNYINTVGDLQTVILQALNIQKDKLLFIIHKDKILGKDYPFSDNLAEKELFDLNLFVVLDPYQVEDGTKETYNSWLNEKIVDNNLISANQQLLYFNTRNQLNSPNLNFFTRRLNTQESQAAVQNSLQQELRTINQNRPRRRGTSTARSNLFPNLFSSGGGSRQTRRAPTAQTERNNNITVTNNDSTAATTTTTTGVGQNDLQQMLQTFMGDGAASGSGLSGIFSEMMSQNIYDLGVTMTQGPNGNSIGLVASGTVGGNSDFFRRIMSDLEPVPVTLSRESVNELPVFKFSELPEQIKDNNSCSICLEDFGDDDQIRVLLCKHYFHTDCIDRWLTEENVRCPLCRHDSRDDVDEDEVEEEIVDIEEKEEERPRRKKSTRKKKSKSSGEDKQD